MKDVENNDEEHVEETQTFFFPTSYLVVAFILSSISCLLFGVWRILALQVPHIVSFHGVVQFFLAGRWGRVGSGQLRFWDESSSAREAGTRRYM